MKRSETVRTDRLPNASTAVDSVTDARARMAHELHDGTKVERTITVMKPVEELYSFWRDFSNLPKFMRHLRAVEVISPVRSRWTWETLGGVKLKWETEIIAEIQDRMISWESLPDGPVIQAGSVWFKSAPQDQATEIHVQIMYRVAGGRLAQKTVQKLAELFGEEPSQTLNEDLRCLRWLFEAGETPTTRGQPKGTGGTLH